MSKKIFKGLGKVANLATGGILGAAVRAVGGKKKPKAAPTPEPVMPIADDEDVRRARRRSITKQLQRGGRESTILSDSSTRLGG